MSEALHPPVASSGSGSEKPQRAMVGEEEVSSDSQSQQEKGDAPRNSDALADGVVGDTVYPSGFRLAIIVAALFMAVFLFALDMVRGPLCPLRGGDPSNSPSLADNRCHSNSQDHRPVP